MHPTTHHHRGRRSGRQRHGEGPPDHEAFAPAFAHGRGRHGKRFTGEELRLMILALLESGPQHGYQLLRALSERSSEAYSPSPGMIYPLLTLLQDMALVEPVGSEGRSRSLVLTAAGRAEVEAQRPRVEPLFERLESMGRDAARTDAAPIRRAVANLRSACMERMSRADADAETAFAIAALIDEAAQKIERL